MRDGEEMNVKLSELVGNHEYDDICTPYRGWAMETDRELHNLLDMSNKILHDLEQFDEQEATKLALITRNACLDLVRYVNQSWS